MIHGATYLRDIATHLSEAKFETIQTACEHLIDDTEVDAKKKLKLIKNTHKIIVKAPYHILNVSNAFGLYFKKLSIDPGLSKDKQHQCLLKAEELFNKALLQDANNYNSHQCLADVYSQLSSLNKKKYSHLAEKHCVIASNLEGKTANADCIITKLDSFQQLKLSPGYIDTLITVDGFDRKLQELDKTLSELSASNNDDKITAAISTEKLLVQEIINHITETGEQISEFKKELGKEQKPKSLCTAVIEAATSAMNEIDLIMQQLPKLEHCRENKCIEETANTMKTTLEKFISYLEKNQNSANNDNGQNHTHCLLTNLRLYKEKSDKIEENNRLKIEVHGTIYYNRNAIYQAWSDFILFTEKNYFLLSKEKKNMLYKKLLEAEKVFNEIPDIQEECNFVIATYVSILTQMHPFLTEEAEITANIYSIQLVSSELNEHHRKYRRDNEMLTRILSTAKKRGNSTENTPMLSARESPHNTIRKDAGDLMEQAIKKHPKQPIESSLSNFLTTKKVKNNDIFFNMVQSIKTIYSSICTIDLHKHGLIQSDALRIAYAVENALRFNIYEGYANKSYYERDKQTIYITKNTLTGLNRSLVVNQKTRSFTILSKLHGDLKKKAENSEEYTYITGAIKKISASVTFHENGDKYTHIETILAKPKKNVYFDRSLIKYFMAFEGKRGLSSCLSYMEYHKASSSSPAFQQLFIQDRAECDFYDFLISHDLTKPSTWKAIFAILEDLAYGISFMHGQGYIHWDIKLQNVLVKQNKDTSYSGEFTDYDTIFDVRNNEQPSWFMPIYGTISYMAPEVDPKLAFKKPPSEKEAKARDIFALGCICTAILELYREQVNKKKSSQLGEESKTKLPLYDQIVYDNLGSEVIDDYIQEKSRISQRTYPEELELISYFLLYPNPAKRWTCDIFLSYISDLQKKINTGRKCSF